MKKIIDGKLYDTDKAELIVEFRRKANVTSIFGDFERLVKSSLYKTEKGAYFEVVGLDLTNPQLSVITEEQAKEIIKTNPDRFMELFPGEVEEA